ncbi:peptidase domain-containing ABC transporter [Enterovibrio norvegicus]|uniref:peptidase domain-containing ABC transporter n=1 Tax=Enterovibrio norvegicus TaxID=188144 RepID=UPI00354E3B7A
MFNFHFKKQLPIYLQSNNVECGITCVAMVSTFYGYITDVASIRRKYETSLNGTSVADLIRISESLGLESRPLRIDLNDLKNLSLPCILHWNMDHFVVLKKLTKKGAVIHDPASGELLVTSEDIYNKFTGIALELKPGLNFRRKKEVQSISISSLLGKTIGLKSTIANLFLVTLSLQAILLLLPLFNQWIIDDVISTKDRELLTILGVGVLTLTLTQVVINFARSWLIICLSTKLSFLWSSHVVSHLFNLPIPWFERRHIGDVTSRFGSVSQIQQTITNNFIEIILDGVFSITILLVLFAYSQTLSFIVILSVVLYFIIRILYYIPLKSALEKSILSSAECESNFLETIRGISSVRLINATNKRVSLWQNLKVISINDGVKVEKLNLVVSTLNGLIFSVENIAILVIAATMVMDQTLTVGMMIAFLSYKAQYIDRTIMLIDRALEFKILKLQCERLADIMLSDRENTNSNTYYDEKMLKGNVCIDNVTFYYDDISNPVIKNLSININAGESVAITGLSGCGKSTLVKLLLGIHKPQEGSIYVDGLNINEISLGKYRESIGVVMQEDRLFSGTIMENICFFSESPDLNRVKEAAKLASIDKDIEAMPMKYNSLVGDMGDALSGGQKQRIIIARAMYGKPRMLIFDEATSNLDVGNENSINTVLDRMNMTRIIIAHRPETIRMASREINLSTIKLTK